MAKSRGKRGAKTAGRYFERFVEDERLRGNLREAAERGRSAYARLTSRGDAAEAVQERGFRRDLGRAVAAVGQAASSLRERRQAAARRRRRRVLLAAAGVAAIGVAASQGAHRRLIDAVTADDQGEPPTGDEVGDQEEAPR